MAREEDARLHKMWAIQADTAGDFDRARMEYFKFVESWRQANVSGQFERECNDATKEYALFSKRDPLYKKIMCQITPIITKKPGILQKDIYALVPSFTREDLSYVLYFGALNGAIKREKSGRTYALYI